MKSCRFIPPTATVRASHVIEPDTGGPTSQAHRDT